MTDANAITFRAEIKEVNTKKTASLDMTHKVVLYTESKNALLLAAIPGDQEVEVSITPEAPA